VILYLVAVNKLALFLSIMLLGLMLHLGRVDRVLGCSEKDPHRGNFCQEGRGVNVLLPLWRWYGCFLE
jgi:hypothetical protein